MRSTPRSPAADEPEHVNQLEGKVAIVTGGAGGFGEGIARAYVAEGARVVIADLERSRGEALARSLGPAAVFAHCDVSLRPDIDALVRTCVDQFGPPDIVVNNAGTTHTNMPLLDVDEATFDKVFAVNVKSIYHMVLAVVPLMRKRKKRRDPECRLDGGYSSAAGPDLVQRQQGCSESAVEVARSRTRARSHSSQRDLPGDRRDRPARTIHGHARYAGESSEVSGDDSSRPDVPAVRRCRGGGLSGERRCGIHFGRRVSGRRGAHRLS